MMQNETKYLHVLIIQYTSCAGKISTRTWTKAFEPSKKYFCFHTTNALDYTACY